MKINYTEILNQNMINVFKDVLLNIEKNGLQEGHHLYVTFNTNNAKVKIPKWLQEKYPVEMTIIIQNEYWNFKTKNDSFNIGLSFDDIKTDLEIPFNSVISFADPYANFGLRLIPEIKNKNNVQIKKSVKNKNKNFKKDNIIDFNNYKKN
tara:strand:- start:27 stop:476 length:450 start_codon:yes stop_codon:yes gene_type:complete